MSECMNKCLLIGNVGQEPELRSSVQGQSILNLRLATSEKWTDDQGRSQERTEWHTVVLFGKRADSLARIIEKGEKICVEGRLATRSWEDKQGARRYTTEIIAKDIILLGGRRQERGGGQYQQPEADPSVDTFEDDQIPF